jgi:hypothetical protein
MRILTREQDRATSGQAGAVRACRGWSLAETMVGVGVGSLVLLVVAGLSLYTGRTFAGLANYVDLNASSILALDQMTKDVRQAVSVTSYSSNELALNYGPGQPAVTFTYNVSSRKLIRQEGTKSKTLLKECDALSFAIYQRTPIGGTFDQYPVGEVTNCKLVAVSWNCSRKLLGTKANTEAAQTAKIVIRKK